MICCDPVSKLMSSSVKMTFYVGCHGENGGYRYLSVGVMNYSCGVVHCPYCVTRNSLCRSYGDFGCGIFNDVIVIWIYCICTCLCDSGVRWIYWDVFVKIVIGGDVQVYLKVVSCVGNPLLFVFIHCIQNIVH